MVRTGHVAAEWSADDFIFCLSDGMSPYGDFVGDDMADVIDHSTSKLTDADRKAMAKCVLQFNDYGRQAKP